MMAGVTGRLVLVGTPIGDFSDASARLRKVLAEVDVVAAEDTRRLKRLTSELAIVVSGRVVSFFEGNER
jgi:16S rRNA (cytidine1402-2'-O)-methyltransferase